MGGLPQGIADRAHRRAETEDQRVQHSYTQSYSSLASCDLRGVGADRSLTEGAN